MTITPSVYNDCNYDVQYVLTNVYQIIIIRTQHTVISRNFARAIIVFKHRFSPVLKRTRRQYESLQKLKHNCHLFVSFRVQMGVKTNPALFRTRAILREITVVLIFAAVTHGQHEIVLVLSHSNA